MWKSLLFIVALAALGLVAREAQAKPITLDISVKDANKICGGAAGVCLSPCGSTICDVNCKYDKDTKSYSGCTVTIYRTVPRGRHVTRAGTTTK